ncbi:MAG: Lrp/AsnC family transcriptional regulator [Candidatus Bathyarchaeota archaeon]|nr:Lrp/AsnC family transcriptional regulator [Candidatus Bathyarchaeum tardum]WGM90328.1 MAG: Lrp/AsnC family transcriptional regulator [Candidatus Bathyarchaeum tardum]
MLDDIDKIMLKKLLVDVRTSFSDIAKELDVSVVAVVKRFNKLKKMGVIAGTTLVLDLSENEKMFALAITIDLINQSYEKEVTEKIKKIKTIMECIPVIGNYDIFAVAYTRNIDEIKGIQDRIKKIPGVEKIKISTNLDKNFLFVENII